MNRDQAPQPLGLFWLTLLCIAVVGFSLLFNLKIVDRSAMKMLHIKGQTVTHLIQTTRLWNARHGGVYVPVTEDTPVNGLLQVPERDIVSPAGVALTKVNPAYMTRQLADMLRGTDIELHLTSLKPLNPINKPDAWEQQALMHFEQGHGVQAALTGDFYRYMAPLKIEAACLECHRQQGYRPGDVRGGLSLKFPRQDIDQLVQSLKTEVQAAHVVLFFSLWLASLVIYLGFRRLNSSLLNAADKERQLNNLAMTDELTGVLNRRSLMQVYEQAFALAERKNWPLAVLMLDIDHFKAVNDCHGHLVGDEVLARFARTVAATLRECDTVGRFGGEEFLVILQDESPERAMQVAERIRLAVAGQIFQGNEHFHITVSIGVAERAELGSPGQTELLNAADQALYQAKEHGRNRCCRAGCDVLPEQPMPHQ